LLSDALPASAAKSCFNSLLTAPDLIRTTVYFRFYLFETYQKFGRGELVLSGLEFWREMLKYGLKTPVEHPEPARSDCHAWSSHPLFHLFATVAGIRPAAPGFAAVAIEPHLGDLPELTGEMPHPRGSLKFDFRPRGSRIILPLGITGTYRHGNYSAALHEGENRVD
jgi:hypothetical protein